ncbi:DNA replication/repair protein RecF [Bifidobacterium vespertilionis]|uniref:DNA replication and repair protein RecF n=1 Tax=Bifidobacterium vespertilionis TaxID=2562524 RepID=A0A5J5DTJ2_9BIFI|nr:DNA replication/repair protein RecF [Bifidobacterium vespertilionis]KAA8818640.1 DNA replication/repair protein RecF [Bifidobacterium vespertilionis]KAA8823095.1 DNA replication/repair protein RecF [Bifidobacterium vespertilionis]
MHISRLALDHYRSWTSCVVDLSPGVNILQGRNGLGKTNLVEAIEVLATGSSHRTSSSLPLVQRGERTATIRANVDDSGRSTTYELTVPARGANRARINGGPSLYMRDILGRIPCVTFAPEDQRLVSGDPAGRRGFLNQAGSLLDPGYWDLAQRFVRIAKQRAALLKQLANGVDASMSGLEIWTGQFIEAGVALTRLRARLVERLDGPFSRIYARLAGDSGASEARLVYEPSFDEVLAFDEPEPHISEHFRRIYPGEASRGVNLLGPQRDDVSIELMGVPAREYASNGEMWTMALALRMALFEVIGETGANPIVILDDVFAQLDESRRGQILDFAAGREQVLITVAAHGDIPHLDGLGTRPQVIDVAAVRAAESSEAPDDVKATL